MELVYHKGDKVIYLGNKAIIAHKDKDDIIIEFLEIPTNTSFWDGRGEEKLIGYINVGTGEFAYAALNYLEPLNELYPIWN